MTRTEHWRVTKVSCTLGSQVKDNKRTPEASVLPCMFFILEPNREQSVPYEIFSGMCLFSIQTYRDGQNWLVKSSDTAHYDKQQCLQKLQPPRQKTQNLVKLGTSKHNHGLPKRNANVMSDK